jgi:hypothetical protein
MQEYLERVRASNLELEWLELVNCLSLEDILNSGGEYLYPISANTQPRTEEDASEERVL